MIDWKLVLEKYFDKKIQTTGNHAYRLLQPITIRVDGKDISLPQRSLVTFEQQDIAVIRERDNSPEKHHIDLQSVSLVTREEIVGQMDEAAIRQVNEVAEKLSVAK